jgi:hypothetical protein
MLYCTSAQYISTVHQGTVRYHTLYSTVPGTVPYSIVLYFCLSYRWLPLSEGKLQNNRPVQSSPVHFRFIQYSTCTTCIQYSVLCAFARIQCSTRPIRTANICTVVHSPLTGQGTNENSLKLQYRYNNNTLQTQSTRVNLHCDSTRFEL